MPEGGISDAPGRSDELSTEVFEHGLVRELHARAAQGCHVCSINAERIRRPWEEATDAEAVVFEIRGEGWGVECVLRVLVGLIKHQFCRLPIYAACVKSGNGLSPGRVD
jgi:hypothetical protein